MVQGQIHKSVLKKINLKLLSDNVCTYLVSAFFIKINCGDDGFWLIIVEARTSSGKELKKIRKRLDYTLRDSGQKVEIELAQYQGMRKEIFFLQTERR